MNIPNLMLKAQTLLSLYRIDPELPRLVRRIKKSNQTFLSYPKLLSLSQAFLRLQKQTPGQIDVAEFGVGRGGSAVLLAFLIQKFGGTLTLYDLFGQIPPPTETDGPDAQHRYEKIINAENTKDYYGNIPDLLSVIKTELSRITDVEKIDFVIGKYEDNLPTLTDQKRFHLVHIDCDWYESTLAVLEYLRPRLAPGAILQFDDYGFWSGTKKAVDETAWLNQLPRHRVGEALIIAMPHPH